MLNGIGWIVTALGVIVEVVGIANPSPLAPWRPWLVGAGVLLFVVGLVTVLRALLRPLRPLALRVLGATEAAPGAPGAVYITGGTTHLYQGTGSAVTSGATQVPQAATPQIAPAPGDWRLQSLIQNRAFQITEIPRIDGAIQGRIFEDCTITGPAILVPQGSTFDSPLWEVADNTVESILFEITGQTRWAVGPIAVRNCTFRRCTFREMGIMGSKELLDQVRAAMGPPPGA